MDPSTQSAATRAVVVAAFDVDKTLTTRDCVVPFLRLVGGRRFVLRLLRRSPVLIGSVLRRRRDRIKAVVTRVALAERPLAEVDAAAQVFAERVWGRHMRPDTVARLRWHLAQDHRVVLVSASYRNYLEPLARRLGAHAVLSTELEVVDGVCTGELQGANCRAGVKVERLRAWIDDHGWDSTVIHAYGDSAGDLPMLGIAHHAYRVGSDPLPEVPETVA